MNNLDILDYTQRKLSLETYCFKNCLFHTTIFAGAVNETFPAELGGSAVKCLDGRLSLIEYCRSAPEEKFGELL